MLKIESFSLLCEAQPFKIESDVFEASGYKWRLDLYPNGNYENENDGNHICLYLVICETESLPKKWEICVDVNLFVYDHPCDKYASFQDVDGNRTRFHGNKIEWGLDELISLDDFKDSKNGYLLNDSCVFGAEVFAVQEYTQKDRYLSLLKPPATSNTHTWKIDKFSAIEDLVLDSEVFKVGKIKWKLSVWPKGYGEGDGSHLSITIQVHDASTFPVGWRVFAKYMFRVKNQIVNEEEDLEDEGWFDDTNQSWGYCCFMLLSELNDSTNGFLLNDNLIVEAKFSVVGMLKSFI